MHLSKKLFLPAIIILIYIILPFSIYCQNLKEARKTIEKLCSKDFSGRGYSNNGEKKAAAFLTERLKKYKVKYFGSGYQQPFDISVNAFPGDLKLSLNDSLLVPGYDYLINGTSGSIDGTFPVIVMDHELVDYPEKFKAIETERFKKSFLLIDTAGIKNQGFKDAVNDIVNSNLFGARGIIEIEPKNLIYSPAPVVFPFPRIKILRSAIPEDLKTISIKIENQYFNNYTTQNIAAFISGSIDTFIVITAHYDHVGQMGKDVFFPGANDNASGVSMVLDMVSYYAKNQRKLKYSMAFIFFSGEELGLLGSSYYTQNPLFPLSKIKFLVNLDMVGSGDKGIKVVNGTQFKPEFDKLVEFNKTNNYLTDISIRGPAANSDHYPFYDKGVKCFYIYTLGEYSEYHSIFDKPQGLPLVEYEDLFRLLVDFVHSFGWN